MVMAKKRIRPGGKSKGGNPWRERLRAIRRKYGSEGKMLTQAEAAERLGVSVHTWVSWENGRTVPSKMAVRLLEITFK